MQKKAKKLLIVTLIFVVALAVMIPGMTTNVATAATAAEYRTRFNTLYTELQGNGYLSPEGVPYHSIETLMCEAPDYGHETTSEAFSFMTWLAALNGKINGQWTDYQNAWNKTETYMIPSAADQPGFGSYNPADPADYAPEADDPNQYPTTGDSSFPTGSDPLWSSLSGAYGSTIYQMHWIMDVDNWYKYGKRGDQTSRCGFINTYQRGPQESCWETVPHPSWEDFDFGTANAGFLPIFGNFGSYGKQWRYTSASDADARQIQASYWANVWAKEQSVSLSTYNAKAAKMGDFLRCTFFDKYWRPLGVQNTTGKGTGYDSCHYLLSWYMSWGGDLAGAWAFKIGSSFAHFGYQNPLTAYVLGNDSDFANTRTLNGVSDWKTSLTRQVEFFQWLQSAEGAIAGGATNSWGGRYLAYPAGTSQFYKMGFDVDPVYHDPPSNQWFGMQVWGMDRMIEYYYVTGDAKAKAICDKWANWAVGQSSATATSFSIPSDLSWSGQPDNFVSGTVPANTGLHCTVTVKTTTDVGVAAGFAKCLIYYAAASKKHTGTAHAASLTLAQNILDAIWSHKTTIGCTIPEDRSDYSRFVNQVVYIPSSYTGTNGQGAQIKSGITFAGMRPAYANDPQWSKVSAGNGATGLTYHRYWAQADIAIANGLMAILFPDDGPTPTQGPTPSQGPTPTTTPTPTRTRGNTPTNTPTPTRGNTRSAFTQIEAESYNTQSGIQTETCSEGGQNVGYIQNGDYTVYNNIDFGTGATGFQARVASATSGGNIEIRLDSASGTLIGTCSVAGTGGWQTWTNRTCTVSGVTGVHNLYLRFTGGSGYFFNLNWFKFTAGTTTPTNTPTPTRRGPTPTNTPTPTYTPTPTRGNTPTPTPTPPPGGYVVTYTISDWGGAGNVDVIIKNNTANTVNGWTLAWTFPGTQRITNMWNAAYTQSGASVTATNLGYNNIIAANGGTVSFGFSNNYTGSNTKPTAFTLNGVACQIQ